MTNVSQPPVITSVLYAAVTFERGKAFEREAVHFEREAVHFEREAVHLRER
jgi:hypothetical protein